MFINVFKPYYFYQVLKNIKNNNISQVKELIETHFPNAFLQFFFHYSYSYSYDCFRYFYLRLKIKNGKNYSISYYRTIKLKKDFKFEEINQIFNYQFIQEEEEFSIETKLNRLRYQIIKAMIKEKKYESICHLVLPLGEKEKESIFSLYFDDIDIVDCEEIIKITEIFAITKQFYEEKVFVTYGIDINKSQYDFLRKNYNFESQYWEACFLKTENNEIIEDIIQHYDFSLKTKLNKVYKSLLWAYEYRESEDIINKILLFKKLNLLTKENIINSYTNDLNPIYIDYHYHPLLDIDKTTEKELLKHNLKLIILYGGKEYGFSSKNQPIIIEELLNNYFNYIKDKIEIETDYEFITEAIEISVQTSEEITLYFYHKFPELFMQKSYAIFDRLLNSNQKPDKILQQVILEQDKLKKEKLIYVIIRNISNKYYYHNTNNMVYFFIKEEVSTQLKEKLLNKKIKEKEALPILIDILEEDYFKNQEKRNEIFFNSIGQDVNNALYFIENYLIEKESLLKSFINLSYYKIEETHIELAKKILEKEIELSEFEQESLQESSVELYKLYQSYSLNRKLNNKLQPKSIKTKKLKI